MRYKNSVLLLVLYFISVFATSCTSITIKNDPRPDLVWPQAPETARIKYEYAFAKADDLGIEKGFWQWLGEFFTGSQDIQMIRPMAITINSNGVIFVADPGAKGVHRFDTIRHKYNLLGLENGVGLPSPVALTSDTKGNVFLTDSVLGKVFFLTSESEYATPLKLDEPLKQPTGLALDNKTGNLYVVDTAQHQVLVFNQGKLVKRIGQHGSGKAQFNFPTMLWLNQKGYLLVTDSLNFRIQRFDLKGQYLGQFGQLGDGSGNHARPKGLAADLMGHIYVVDSLFHNVQIFNNKGAFLLNIGEQGSDRGQFWLPTGIYIDQQQKIYVADSHNRRVQVFSYLGVKQ